MQEQVKPGHFNCAFVKGLLALMDPSDVSNEVEAIGIHSLCKDCDEGWLVKAFLDSQPAMVESKDGKGRTPLMVAIEHQFRSIREVCIPSFTPHSNSQADAFEWAGVAFQGCVAGQL